MSLWEKIFGKKDKLDAVDISAQIDTNFTPEYKSVCEFNKQFKSLLSQNRYISKKDYAFLYSEFQNVYVFFNNLVQSQMLNAYVEKNHLDINQIKYFHQHIQEIKDVQNESRTIKSHNDTFIAEHLISEKNYLDTILRECDPNILLDEEQRRVVLSDEDHTLVIAGAGAGKTTTVAAKVRYLVDRQGIKPEEILVISFTNKAVNELQERINVNLQIKCPISTFHKVGFAIIKKDSEVDKKVVDDGYLFNVLCNYLKSTVLKNEKMVTKLVLFFGSYFSAPYEGDNLTEYFKFIANADLSTLKSNLHEYVKQVIDSKTHKVTTLNNEILRSQEEVNIANFLYLNQIDYEYEPLYQYKILDAKKPYTPDFVIKQGDKQTYIEHFGITEDGVNNMYSPEELEKYKQRVNQKIKLHRQHHTDLIYTFSRYKDGNTYLEHLRESLEQRGYVLNRRSDTEVYKKLIETEETKYIMRLAYLLCTFISNFKTQGFDYDKFDDFKNGNKNERTKLFLDICKTCYLEYQKCLEQDNAIDFQDMINYSDKLIKDKRISKERLGFKYIIVDEYQDISRQRYKLIKSISELCDAKIVAVGDDWQSIYAFSGSILPLFTRFCKEFGYGVELKITRTYRNAQELINIAGNFVQRNDSQIHKELISNKRIDTPVIITTYSEEKAKNQKEYDGGKYRHLGNAVNKAIGTILDRNEKEGEKGVASILLIGRYGFDARNLCKSPEFNYDEYKNNIYSVKYGNRVKLSFLTAHASKGLSADNVIIINAKDETYGFPSKVEDDPILNLVVCYDDSYNYAEERRLFYVALTRTRNRVVIVTPESRPSEFIKELLRETALYPNVQLQGALKADVKDTSVIKNKCPICGYPMQLRMNKNYGLRLWICTNDQELCGFMTNDRRGEGLSIKKCDWCQDGYLVIKRKVQTDNYFLGCTNYKSDGSGCKRIINKDQYQYWNDAEFGINDLSVNRPFYSRQKPANQEEISAPEMIQQESKARKGHANIVYTTTTNMQTIDGVEYELLADMNGRILTDIKLLKQLRNLRIQIANKFNTTELITIPNNSLVELATRRPTTREELMKITGLGEKRINRFGAQIIQIIKNTPY